jgi:hypothetical protein
MLSFGNPLALLLASLALLVALLYFLRMRFRRQPAGSVFIWRLFIDKNEGGRKVRRKSLLLLLLQLVAVGLAVFALAAPSLSSSGSALPGVAYLVDVSASMGGPASAGKTGKRLEEAARLIAEDIGKLDAGRPVAAFACSNGASSLAKSGASPLEIAAAVARLEAGDAGLDEEAAARDLSGWLAREPGSWEARIYGDGGWSLGGERIRAVFADAVKSVAVGSDAGDLGVYGLGVEALPGGGAEARFTVTNSFPDERPFRAVLRSGGTEFGSVSGIAVPGSARSSLSLSGIAPEAGYELALDGAGDGYAADDSSYVSLARSPRARVLALVPPGPFLGAAFSAAEADIAEAPGEGMPAAGECDIAILSLADASADPPCNVLFIPAPGAEGKRVSGDVTGSSPSHPLSRFVRWEGEAPGGAIEAPEPPEARVLARSGGLPVITAWESHGFKRVALGLDPSSYRVGISAAFPLFARNVLEWCVPGAGKPGTYTLVAGVEERLPLSAAPRSDKPRALAFRAEGGATWALAAKKGLYTVVFPGRGKRVVAVAANIPASEIDVAPRTLVMPATPVMLAQAARKKSLPLGPAAAAALFLCLCAEWLLWRGLGKGTKPRPTAASRGGAKP